MADRNRRSWQPTTSPETNDRQRDRKERMMSTTVTWPVFQSALVSREMVAEQTMSVLFHANRRPEDAAFADEFRALERTDPNLTFVLTMTAMAGSTQAWDGERGHIDAAMLGRHLDGLIDPIYYIAGPTGMVQASRSMLVASGVDEDDIRTEEFIGY